MWGTAVFYSFIKASCDLGPWHLIDNWSYCEFIYLIIFPLPQEYVRGHSAICAIYYITVLNY